MQIQRRVTASISAERVKAAKAGVSPVWRRTVSPGNPWAPVRWRVLSRGTRPNKELHCDDVYSCEKRNHLISNQEKNRPRAVSTRGGGGDSLAVTTSEPSCMAESRTMTPGEKVQRGLGGAPRSKVQSATKASAAPRTWPVLREALRAAAWPALHAPARRQGALEGTSAGRKKAQAQTSCVIADEPPNASEPDLRLVWSRRKGRVSPGLPVCPLPPAGSGRARTHAPRPKHSAPLRQQGCGR